MPDSALRSVASSTYRRRIWLRMASWLLVLAALLIVFLLYTRPDFVVNMANQLWACF